MKPELEEFQDGLLWQVREGRSVTIGVTESALDMAGAVVAVELSEVGDEFEAGDWIGEIQGKNSLVEILAPCRLKLVERSEDVLAQPGMIDDDPTGDAWLIRAETLDG
jgi:glycine cleavage system H protein